MRLSLCTVALAALATCSITYADTYTPPPRAATFASRDTVAESLTQDLQAEQTVFAAPAGSFNPVALTSKDHSRVVISSNNGSPLLRVDLPTSVLEAYAGSSICALTSRCGESITVSDDTSEQSTGLEAAVEAIAPEPPSVILLATGLLLAVAAVVSRQVSGRTHSF